jgi:glycerol uptake facilitator-like aquaporin
MAAEATTARRLVGEALGTALLLSTVVGSGIMAERLSGGNDGPRCSPTRWRPAPSCRC